MLVDSAKGVDIVVDYLVKNFEGYEALFALGEVAGRSCIEAEVGVVTLTVEKDELVKDSERGVLVGTAVVDSVL